MRPRSHTPLLVALCVVAAFFAGALATGQRLLPDGVLKAVGVDEKDQTHSELVDQIKGNYYKPVSDQQLEDASLKGIVDSLHDRFSHYFTPKETEEFNRSVNDPSFEGVGISVAQDKRGLRVVQVFDNSPAKKAGIVKEDVITAVAGQSIAGKSSDVATAKIKGK